MKAFTITTSSIISTLTFIISFDFFISKNKGIYQYIDYLKIYYPILCLFLYVCICVGVFAVSYNDIKLSFENFPRKNGIDLGDFLASVIMSSIIGTGSGSIIGYYFPFLLIILLFLFICFICDKI